MICDIHYWACIVTFISGDSLHEETNFRHTVAVRACLTWGGNALCRCNRPAGVAAKPQKPLQS